MEQGRGWCLAPKKKAIEKGPKKRALEMGGVPAGAGLEAGLEAGREAWGLRSWCPAPKQHAAHGVPSPDAGPEAGPEGCSPEGTSEPPQGTSVSALSKPFGPQELLPSHLGGVKVITLGGGGDGGGGPWVGGENCVVGQGKRRCPVEASAPPLKAPFEHHGPRRGVSTCWGFNQGGLLVGDSDEGSTDPSPALSQPAGPSECAALSGDFSGGLSGDISGDMSGALVLGMLKRGVSGGAHPGPCTEGALAR